MAAYILKIYVFSSNLSSNRHMRAEHWKPWRVFCCAEDRPKCCKSGILGEIMATANEARKTTTETDQLKDFIMLHYPADTYKGALHVWAKSKRKGYFYRYKYGEPLEVLQQIRADRAQYRIQDYYITANTMSAGTRDNSNIYALHNIVIDIDNHGGADPAKLQHQYNTITEYYRFKEMDASGDFIPNTIVFTGRGFQLWYAIEQVSYKRIDIYETLTGEIIKQVEQLLKDHTDTLEGLELDAGASRNAAGLFRAPWSYNRKAGARAQFTILHDDYINTMEEAKRIRARDNTEKIINYKTALNSADLQATKRTNSIIQLVKLRQGKGETIRRNNILFCISCIWGKVCRDDMEIMERVRYVNRLFTEPMTEKELNITMKTALIKRYSAKNRTIIEKLEITEQEQETINFYPGNNREQERAKKREEKASRDKQVIKLYENGATQENIAAALNISRRTVCNILERYHARRIDAGRLFERETFRDDKTDAEPETNRNGAHSEATEAYNDSADLDNGNLCKKRPICCGNNRRPAGKGTQAPEYLRLIPGGKDPAPGHDGHPTGSAGAPEEDSRNSANDNAPPDTGQPEERENKGMTVNNIFSVQLFSYLIEQGYTDKEARAFLQRRNAYKETAKDKAVYKQYKEHLKQIRDGETPEE